METKTVRQLLEPLIRKRDMYERTFLNMACSYGWIIALWGIVVYFYNIPKEIGVILLITFIVICSMQNLIFHVLYLKSEKKIRKLQDSEEYNKIALHEERQLLVFFQELAFLNPEIPQYKRKVEHLQNVIKDREEQNSIKK